MAIVLFHPALSARRAAEIAQSQGAKIGRDACGRPFVLPRADPLGAEPAQAVRIVVPRADPMRFAWLIRALRAIPVWRDRRGSRPWGQAGR